MNQIEYKGHVIFITNNKNPLFDLHKYSFIILKHIPDQQETDSSYVAHSHQIESAEKASDIAKKIIDNPLTSI